jgi:hypothetical protein
VRVCEIKGISQTLGRGVGFACLSFGLLVSLSPFACLSFGLLLGLLLCLFVSFLNNFLISKINNCLPIWERNTPKG